MKPWSRPSGCTFHAWCSVFASSCCSFSLCYSHYGVGRILLKLLFGATEGLGVQIALRSKWQISRKYRKFILDDMVLERLDILSALECDAYFKTWAQLVVLDWRAFEWEDELMYSAFGVGFIYIREWKQNYAAFLIVKFDSTLIWFFRTALFDVLFRTKRYILVVKI